MTDYEIQKATAAKVGVVSPPDNIYGCRKAILEKLGGDSTDADTIYECDKRILPFIDKPANLQEKSVNITENGTTSILPDSGYNLSKVDVNVDVQHTPVQVKSVNIIENGTTSIVPDSGYNLSKVDVNVKVPLKLVNGTKFRNSKFTVCPDYDFSDITDMKGMFENCSNLTSVPEMNTSNVTNMNMMFYNCTSLTSIPQIDTSNVTNMNFIFRSCERLTSVPNMNTSNVKDMFGMFMSCYRLTTIPNLDTSNVTDIGMMFYSCSSLTSIPAFNTGNVTDMSEMFYNCEKLTNLGGLTNIGKAFTSAQTLDISPTSILTNQSVQNIIDTVYDMNQNTTGGSATLKLAQTVIDAMSDTQKSQLAAKGWTLTN